MSNYSLRFFRSFLLVSFWSFLPIPVTPFTVPVAAPAVALAVVFTPVAVALALVLTAFLAVLAQEQRQEAKRRQVKNLSVCLNLCISWFFLVGGAVELLELVSSLIICWWCKNGVPLLFGHEFFHGKASIKNGFLARFLFC